MKNILCCFALLCMVSPAFAQFSIGLSVGPNLSFWKWELKQVDTGNLFDPAIGVRTTLLGEWQMSRVLGLRAEVGTQLKNNRTAVTISSDLEEEGVLRQRYQYWEASLLMQISPIKQHANWYFLAGCTAGQLTNAWQVISGIQLENNDSKRMKKSIDIGGSVYNRNSLAADFGLGTNLPLGPRSSLKIEGRFQFSPSKIINYDLVDTRVSPLILNFGYLYQL